MRTLLFYLKHSIILGSVFLVILILLGSMLSGKNQLNAKELPGALLLSCALMLAYLVAVASPIQWLARKLFASAAAFLIAGALSGVIVAALAVVVAFDERPI